MMWPVASFFLSNNLETDKELATLINLHAYEEHTKFGRIQKMLKVHQYILRNECLPSVIYSDIS